MGYLHVTDICAKTLQAFQDTSVSSEKFHLHLLKVAALAVHLLGGLLYITSHPNTDIRPRDYGCIQYPHYPVDLYHKFYVNYSSYPYGLLDTVGYWTETQVFGGVALFEHDSSGGEVSFHLLIVFGHRPH